VAQGYRLTVRDGPRVERSRHPTLAAAIDALEERLLELSGAADREAIDLRVRRFEPVQQVAARGEIIGPKRWRPAVRAGADVRGDGAVEAYLGRTTRRVIEQRYGESPFDALRRELGCDDARG
jgi:hypothetical protein